MEKNGCRVHIDFDGSAMIARLSGELDHHGVKNSMDLIDKLIDDNLVRWSAKRISKASRAVLRLAVCELLFSQDLPVGVIINEAVEIAKKYATNEDGAYINGVLGSVAKKIR
jgi:N utilization substance protein B